MPTNPVAAPLTQAGMTGACRLLDVGPESLWTVLQVETVGCGFLADRRLQILFERHKFHQFTRGTFSASHPHISNQRPGGYAGGIAEWGRYEDAKVLDPVAALQATSWGVAQIMGFNSRAAGYPYPSEMVAAFKNSEDAQVLAMAQFIRADRAMADAIKRRDWRIFARAYNGPDYAKNEYDRRLARAHGACLHALPDFATRTAQLALLFLTFNPGPVDGFMGRKTRGAIVEFQHTHPGLDDDGVLTTETYAALTAAAWPPTTVSRETGATHV
jgi:hypothetical protein